MKPANMKVICFVNQKGGVGKTASVVNIGAGLAKLNKKVLLIDLDPQESLSYWIGITESGKSVVDFFAGKESLETCVRGQVKHTKNGHKVYHFLSKGSMGIQGLTIA